MAFIWLISMTNYYLILYLVNTFEKVYICSIASSFSEMCAYLVSGYVYDYFGAKKTYIGSFGMAFVGAVFIVTIGLQHQTSWTFVLMVIFAKFGIVCTQNINYAAHGDIFPTLFQSTALGYLLIIAYLFSRARG